MRSPYETLQDVPREQPVPFSHEHHVAGLASIAVTATFRSNTPPFAGIPATKICMNCHSEMWVSSSVHSLPFAQASEPEHRSSGHACTTCLGMSISAHSIHVQQGFGCATCHGRVDACRSRGRRSR